MLKILFLISSASIIIACIVHGNVEGICVATNDITSSSLTTKQMEQENKLVFCQLYLPTYVCVPYFSEIWNTFTNKTIENLIENKVIDSLAKEFINELTASSMPIINSGACWQSYINYMCRSNFKNCDPDKSVSYKVCSTHCSNFVLNCNLDTTECDDLNSEEFHIVTEEEVKNKTLLNDKCN